MSLPVFAVETAQLSDDHIVLDGPEGRHAATIRRLRPGERVRLTDGLGRAATCAVTATGRDRLELQVRDRHEIPAPAPGLTVVQALAKGERGELAVQTMVEVGVDVIVPWEAAHCVARWRGERAAKGRDRWRSTAREAAKQARRSWFPEITELADTAEAVDRMAAANRAVVLHETATTPLSRVPLPTDGPIVVVVGPEGGLADAELDAFRAAGALPVRLGDTVLRTSTAGAAAAAVIQARCGRW